MGVIKGNTRSLDPKPYNPKPYTIGAIKGDTRSLDYSSYMALAKDVVAGFRV